MADRLEQNGVALRGGDEVVQLLRNQSHSSTSVTTTVCKLDLP